MNIINIMSFFSITMFIFLGFVVVLMIDIIIDKYFKHYDSSTRNTSYCTKQTLAKRRMQKDPWIWHGTHVDKHGHKKWSKEAARKRSIVDQPNKY